MTNPLLGRFVGSAVAAFIEPGMQPQFDACINQAHVTMQSADFQNATRAAADTDFWSFEPGSYMAALRPYVVKDGMLQIPVKGVLLNDFPYALFDYATGYDYIWRAFQRGMGDADVKGIALVVSSPGGEVAGNLDLVDRMFALKGTKPIRGFAAEHAYSAAYSIISVADQVNVSRTGGVGSIGVVTGHLDVSKAMEMDGLKFTYIFAGQHKVDGNPYEALPKDVKARIQSRIDQLYSVFVSTVARNRGMEEQAVRATEALTFTAQEALSNGLADSIGALDDSLADYAADLSSDEGDETMSDKKDGTVELAAHETAVSAARTEGVTSGNAEGAKAGAQAERTRIAAILASDEAKERPAAAMAAAMDTDMSLEKATAFLAKLPKETPVAVAPAAEVKPHAQPGFDGAMKDTKNPNVGDGGEAAELDVKSADFALASARAFGVDGLRPAKAN